MTLAEFINARLGEPVVYDEGTPTLEQAQHIVLHDPARVLRQVTAMRAILAEHRAYEETDRLTHRCYVCASGHAYKSGAAIQELWPCPTLRHLAVIWADHEQYDPGVEAVSGCDEATAIRFPEVCKSPAEAVPHLRRSRETVAASSAEAMGISSGVTAP